MAFGNGRGEKGKECNEREGGRGGRGGGKIRWRVGREDNARGGDGRERSEWKQEVQCDLTMYQQLPPTAASKQHTCMITAAPLCSLYGLRSEDPTNVYLPSGPPNSDEKYRNKHVHRSTGES